MSSAAEEAEEFFESFYPRLAGWCRKLVDSDSVAHEIASESFTRLWSRWTTVREPAPYLFSIAANLVKDHWRRQEREKVTVRQLEVVTVDHAPAADHGTDIRALVEALPGRLRVPVLLHYYADLSVNDIAVALHRRPGTIKSDLHAARQHLRASLRGLHETTV
ncbi:RNA polymerase sigma factor [Streptomyces sp. NPDC088733]|uniref:RNA polymerase sigma factor n=1 Tax=Streptomyces sp. NPDC088733 TaxID=3365880 RepID=UPI0037F2555D